MVVVLDVIRGQAGHVMRCLGKGHSERIYHSALITSLNRHGVMHRSEVACPIWFMGECIGMGRADLVIDDVVVEIKANRLAPKETSAQLQKYLVSLSKAERKTYRGIVLNFNQKNGCVDLLEETCEQAVVSHIFKRSLEGEASARVSETQYAKRRRV
jgi:GxxExxY protein